MSRIFIDKVGSRWVLVDKKQQRQTCGRFFNSNDSLDNIAAYISARNMVGYVWDMGVQEDSIKPRTIAEEMAAKRYRLLCLLEECDEEVNEFGIVSP